MLQRMIDLRDKSKLSNNKSIVRLREELGYTKRFPDRPISYFRLLACLNNLLEYYFEQPNYDISNKEAQDFLAYVCGLLQKEQLLENTMAELDRNLIGGDEFLPWQASAFLLFYSKFLNATLVRQRYILTLPSHEREGLLRLALEMMFNFLDLYPFLEKKRPADLVKVLRAHSIASENVKALRLPRDSAVGRQVNIISKN